MGRQSQLAYCTSRYVQMKNPYLDLCRYQAPGDLDSQVKYLPLCRYSQVLPSTCKTHNLQIQVTYDRSRFITTHKYMWVYHLCPLQTTPI